MKNLLKLFILFTFLWWYFTPSPVQASTLFSDKFTTDQITRWSPEPGLENHWILINDTLQGQNDNPLGYGRLYHLANWQDFILEVDFRNYEGLSESVGFRYQDAQNRYELDIFPHGNTTLGGELLLFKFKDGVKVPNFGGTFYAGDPDDWHHLKIEVNGTIVAISVDGQLSFEASIGNDLLTGGISLGYNEPAFAMSKVRFDNVKVTTNSNIPVIFIPGIGGSEMVANQDIIWSEDDGHGEIFSHAYPAHETIWVNTLEVLKPGNDDYFDVLRLKDDGETPMADVRFTSEFVSTAYQDVDQFFSDLGYTKGQNYFVFTYDWRQKTLSTALKLDELVTEVRQHNGNSPVILIAHSMGGLVARNYIQNATRAGKVSQLIELGVPHVGSVSALRQLLDGDWISRMIWIFQVGIVPPSEMHDLVHNFASIYELIPNINYFSQGWPFPWNDERNFPLSTHWDLEYLKFLLTELGASMKLVDFTPPTKTHQVEITTISGSGFPTLGQVHKYWLISWPLEMIPIDDEIYINGDSIIPLEISDYYVEQTHQDLPSRYGQAMGIVRNLLEASNSATLATPLEGQQITIENGDIEDIPDTFKSKSKSTTQVFIKKSAAKTTTKATPKKATAIKVRTYTNNKVSKIEIYAGLPQTPIDIQTHPVVISSGGQTIPPTSQSSGDGATDQTPPTSGGSSSDGQVILTPSDDNSGVDQTHYSTDNGQTVHDYTGPFPIPDSGTVIVSSTDKAGNQEIPKTLNFNRNSNSSPSTSPSSNQVIAQTKTTPSSEPQSSPDQLTAQVLGTQKSPPKNSDETNWWLAFLLLLLGIAVIYWIFND